MQLALRQVDWLAATRTWVVVVASSSVIAFVLASLIAGLSHGSLVGGLGVAADGVKRLFRDLGSLSFRRLWAIAWHSILESVRRRMLWAVVLVLVVLFMFGGWFLQSRPTDHVKVYVSFVLMASTLIAIPAGGLLACLSLPSEIKEMTIHTVVTKPVRRVEIVLGKVIGLTIVATAILLVMGAASYVYMRRSVAGSLAELRQKMAEAKQRGNTAHELEVKDSIEQIESKLTARVPIYAKSLEGPSRNVGAETTYRKYIEGNRVEAAIWHFDNLPVGRLLTMKSVPLEMTFAVFRTHKGEVGRGVVAQITYRNPRTGRFMTDYPFEVREYYVNRQLIPQTNLGELFQASPGALDVGSALDVEVRCLTGGQFLGMAQPDLYILQDTASFGLNFAKGMVGVWVRVFLIICVAVMFSTCLSSYVAMLATSAAFGGGLCMPYLRKLAEGRILGGGPFQAWIRLVSHENLERPLPPGLWTDITLKVDQFLQTIIVGLTHVLPDLSTFNTAPYVANGFDINGELLVMNLLTAFAYAIPFTIAGYFLLQSREIAR